MGSGTIYIGQFLGVPVRLHVSWFLVFALITTSLASAYFPHQLPEEPAAFYWLLGLMTSLLFFLSVLLHELAHSVVARRWGLAVRDIVLFIFGGVSEIMREPQTAASEFVMAIVGPLTSVALSALCGLLWFLTRSVSPELASVLAYIGGINLSLGAFNLLPGFPLDGGRVLRAILWWRTHNLERSTRWASRIGQVVAYGFIFFGVWQALTGNLLNGLWIAFIGWFLDNAAQTAYRELAVRNLLSGHTVGEIMTRGCTAIKPESSLQEIVDHHILATGTRCLPVVENGALLGLLTVHRVKAFPREEWPLRTAREAMIPRAELRTAAPSQGLVDALNEMAEDGVNQLPVLQEGELVGLLTRENIMTFLRTKAELSA